MEKNRKLYPNLVAGVLEALETIFGKKIYADRVIERILKTNKKWGSRDRAFVAENTYEMVRWWRLLWWIYGKEPSLKRKELWNLFGIWWLYKEGNLPDWDKFYALEGFDMQARMKSLPSDTGIQQSFPEWLNTYGEAQLGEKWPDIARSLNIPADLFLRTNTLKCTREDLLETLRKEEAKPELLDFNPWGLRLAERVNVFRLQSFHDGCYEVQDGGSQMIAPFLQVEPGMRVIDACAGAGGKSLHLAALMENKGQIIAMDVEGWKLSELKKRARRNGVSNIETREIEGSKTIKRLYESADRLLLDVPCSGSGVIRRNPDSKWKIQPEHLENVRRTQAEILASYSRMLKADGKLVYATCSIFPDENERQVENFLNSSDGENFVLEEMKMVFPQEQNTDGFFMARMRRSLEV